MTLDHFLQLQQELLSAYGWIIRWWLILFVVMGVMAAALVAVLVTAREMVDKF